MKTNFLLLAILLIFSCNDGKKKESVDPTENKEAKAEVIKDDILKIKLDFKVIQDDKFELYYSENDIGVNFGPDDRLAQYVKASNDYQSITFNLPKGIFPTNFRIDLGDNPIKNETPIEIMAITVEWNGNVINIDNSLVSSFFQPNAYLQQTETGYSRKVINDKYDPFLLVKPVLIKKMELEL